MYNLLMQYRPWEGGTGTVSTDRLFEHTDKALKKQFRNGDSVLFDKMERMPCLFMQEGTEDELAHVGWITRIRPSDSEILIDYSFDPHIDPIPNKVIFGNRGSFDIRNRYEFSRTHWALKDVDLFRTLLRLSRPLRGSPTVFSIAKNEAIDRTLASVMMPFGAVFSPVYQTIQGAAAEVGLACQRADEIWETPQIIQDIVNLIDKSFVVVCDCTGRNANVFYEIGIAHTLGREVVLITQADADIPFDLRHLRYVKYLDNAEGRQKLKVALTERFRHLQNKL